MVSVIDIMHDNLKQDLSRYCVEVRNNKLLSNDLLRTSRLPMSPMSYDFSFYTKDSGQKNF